LPAGQTQDSYLGAETGIIPLHALILLNLWPRAHHALPARI
jgi:hypothetical protein